MLSGELQMDCGFYLTSYLSAAGMLVLPARSPISAEALLDGPYCLVTQLVHTGSPKKSSGGFSLPPFTIIQATVLLGTVNKIIV